MAKSTQHVSHTPDAQGYIRYSEAENNTWATLIERQLPRLEGQVCQEYIDALELMEFPKDRIPQLPDISRVLREHTGWSVAPVPALIDFTNFFKLLANRQFPAATFIRASHELDYLEEPDIFHEVFGHTPLLTDYRFAAFTEAYGKAGLAANKNDQSMLARLFWFTVEFGLINTSKGLRSYGAGIVSSPGELDFALHSPIPERRPFDPLEVLRTPYRIDIYQTVYYTLESFDTLFELASADLPGLVKEARRLGMFEPTYPVKESA